MLPCPLCLSLLPGAGTFSTGSLKIGRFSQTIYVSSIITYFWPAFGLALCRFWLYLPKITTYSRAGDVEKPCVPKLRPAMYLLWQIGAWKHQPTTTFMLPQPELQGTLLLHVFWLQIQPFWVLSALWACTSWHWEVPCVALPLHHLWKWTSRR